MQHCYYHAHLYLLCRPSQPPTTQIRHDHTVTWLAFWKDPINTKEYKYVWLAANSSFKTDSDLAKYEKARKLKDYIGDIRCDGSAIAACSRNSTPNHTTPHHTASIPPHRSHPQQDI